jgi:dipeptidyl-peptidase 4
MNQSSCNTPIWEAYTKAERFLHWNVTKMIYRGEVNPNWIGKDGSFWYRVHTPSGAEFIRVDPSTRQSKPAFDPVRLAAALSAASGKACEPGLLPFKEITLFNGDEVVEFTAWNQHWRYAQADDSIRKTDPPPSLNPGELVSPDHCWSAFTRDNNLYIRSISTGEELALTVDGEPDNGYALSPWANDFISLQPSGGPTPPVALWSPDSKKVLTHKLDQRRVKETGLIQSAPPDGSARPVIHRYRYAMPGDENLAETRIVVLDLHSHRAIFAGGNPLVAPLLTPLELQYAWWGSEGRMVYYLDYTRGHKSVKLYQLNTHTGETRLLLEESSQTYVDVRWSPFPIVPGPDVRVLETTQELLWSSERDGWAHLYLYDLTTGELKNQVTRGAFVVRELKYVDETGRWVYFLASGREIGRDPYLRHLYRASLDGNILQLLTPEDADHAVTLCPDGSCFVDTYSRADLAPVSVLRDARGELLLKLEEADLSRLFEMGWQYPERFSVKASDGVIDLYGLLFKPTDFNPQVCYPVIDAVYPGPQATRTPTNIPTAAEDIMVSDYWDPQALAELGFIVITFDSFGTPHRSKAFHDLGYKKIGEAGGLVEHIPALRQLTARLPYLDLERVGICGQSAGGYASARGILTYPDFFRVAVSSSGNHDQRCGDAVWGEKYLGLVNSDNYASQDNASLVGNLKGHLLLVHGEMDAGVHPALTMQMVDALIKANKDFDLLILPNCTHDLSRNVYYYRKLWDYFVKHLLGVDPPKGYQIHL